MLAADAHIPGVLAVAVDPLASMHPSGEIWGLTGHPVAPEKIAFGGGREGNRFRDHGMDWKNSGRKTVITRQSSGRTKRRPV